MQIDGWVERRDELTDDIEGILSVYYYCSKVLLSVDRYTDMVVTCLA